MDLQHSLISAVHEGRLERVRVLIGSYGLSYCQAWSEGYVLLRDAIDKNHTEIAKLLLTNGSKVNSKNQNSTNTPLHFAVTHCNIEIVGMLLDRHANIDAMNKDGRTPLHIAVVKKEMEITELLLNRGADVDARDRNSITPLHVAIHRGYLQIIECLLKHGAYVNSTCNWISRSGNTPLHLAAEKGSEEIINLLLSSNASVDAKDQNGTTPLHIAAENGHLQIAKHLLKYGASVNSACTSTRREGYTPLHLAAEKGSEEIIKLLLSNNADVNANAKDNLTPLYIATKQRHEKVVELLLDHGADVDTQDKDGKTILHFAAEKGHLYFKVLNHILKYCPNVNNKSNRSSLNAAVHGSSVECGNIVESLLRYGFTVNPDDVNNFKLLHAAVEKGYLKIVEDLLKYGSDVNILCNLTSEKRYTLLHTATKKKQEAVAALLINYGADVNAKDETGKTPILYAAENADFKITKLLLTDGANVKDSPDLLSTAVKKECKEIVEILLQHGADINASDQYGKTALHFTALSEDRGFFGFLNEDPDINIKGEIATLLLSRGANVNAQTEDGITTLHAAAQKGYAKVVEALLEYNADVKCAGQGAITPLHLAAQKGNEVICKMLLNKGANVNAKHVDGRTALHIASQEGHEEVAKVLLKCGANVYSKIEKDLTPLHIAAHNGYLEIVKILLKFGADIDSRDEYGTTALHIASKEGHEQVVTALLEFGSDINIMSKNNYTPLNYAMASIGAFNNQLENNYDNDYYNDDRVLENNYDCDNDYYNYDYLLENNYDVDNDYYNHNQGYCASEKIVEILKLRIVMMKTANLYVSQENLRSITCDELDFQNECQEEMERMKSEKITNSNISFHDLLTNNISQLAIYARNENIVQVLKSEDYEDTFPIYARMINRHFRKGIERKELLEQGNISFYSLFNSFPELPHNCTEKILSHLIDKDLRILIDACKHTNISSPDTDINKVARGGLNDRDA